MEIERGDLLRLLASVAGEIRFGVGPAAIDDTGSGVECGSPTAPPGASTSSSAPTACARQSASSSPNPAPAQRRSTHSGTRSRSSNSRPRWGLTTEEMTYVAPGTTALLYATAGGRPGHAPVRPRGAAAAPTGRRRSPFCAGGSPGGAGGARILAALDGADDIYLDSVSQVSLPRWSRGAVGLVGDSAACASPASGQGTTLGLVTAYVTAVELASTPRTFPGALTRAGEPAVVRPRQTGARPGQPQADGAAVRARSGRP